MSFEEKEKEKQDDLLLRDASVGSSDDEYVMIQVDEDGSVSPKTSSTLPTSELQVPLLINSEPKINLEESLYPSTSAQDLTEIVVQEHQQMRIWYVRQPRDNKLVLSSPPLSAKGPNKGTPLPLRENALAIIGATRGGKSFLLNCLANQEEMAKTSSDLASPCTANVQISVHPVPLSSFIGATAQPDEMQISFIDTEGQGDKGEQHDVSLLAPLLLLTKTVLFNWKGGLEKNTILQRLGTLVNAARFVHNATAESSAAKPEKLFGHLHIVLRDWMPCDERARRAVISALLEDEPCGSGEGIDLEAEMRNIVRTQLRLHFVDIHVWLLPAPRQRAALLPSVSFAHRSDEFVAAVDSLRRVLALQLNTPMTFGGAAITGPMKEALLPSLLAALNDKEQTIRPVSLMQSLIEQECSTVKGLLLARIRSRHDACTQGHTATPSRELREKLIDANVSLLREMYDLLSHLPMQMIQPYTEAVALECDTLVEQAIERNLTLACAEEAALYEHLCEELNERVELLMAEAHCQSLAAIQSVCALVAADLCSKLTQFSLLYPEITQTRAHITAFDEVVISLIEKHEKERETRVAATEKLELTRKASQVSLETKVSSLSEEIASLQSAIIAEKKSSEFLQEESASTSQRFEAITQELKDALEVLEQDKTESESRFRLRQAELERVVEDLRSQICDFELQKSLLVDQVRQTQAALKDAKQELETTWGQATVRNAENHEKIFNLERELKEYKQFKELLEDRGEKLASELSYCRGMLVSQAQSYQLELKAALEEKEVAMAQVKAEMELLTNSAAKLDLLEHERHQQSASLEEKQASIAALGQKVVALESQLRESVSREGALKLELASVSEARKVLLVDLTALQSQVTAKSETRSQDKAAFDQVEREKARLQASLQESRDCLDVYLARVQELELKLSQSMGQVLALESQEQGFVAQIQDLEASLKLKSRQLVLTQEENSLLQDELVLLTQELDQSRKKFATKQVELASASNSVLDLTAGGYESDDMVRRLLHEIEQLKITNQDQMMIIQELHQNGQKPNEKPIASSCPSDSSLGGTLRHLRDQFSFSLTSAPLSNPSSPSTSLSNELLVDREVNDLRSQLDTEREIRKRLEGEVSALRVELTSCKEALVSQIELASRETQPTTSEVDGSVALKKMVGRLERQVQELQAEKTDLHVRLARMCWERTGSSQIDESQ